MRLSGREKATIFLSLLGPETSSAVLRYLPGELADLIAAGLNHLPAPTPEALNDVMHELQGYLALPHAPQPPQIEPPVPDTPLGQIEIASPKKIAYLLSFERPQTAAFLLYRLSADLREETLTHLPAQRSEIEMILKDIKPNFLTSKLEARLMPYFAGRLA